jgi:hypothetical protein
VAGGEFGTDVEGLQGMVALFQGHTILYIHEEEGKTKSLEFLPSSDRPPQKILSGPGPCQRQHTCGVEVKILFKTWQGETKRNSIHSNEGGFATM